MEIRVFSELVSKSRITEECVRKAAKAENDYRESYRREHNQGYATRGNGKGKQAAAALDVLNCQRCEGHHPNRPCRYGSDLCYNCGKLGHLVKDSPHQKNRGTASCGGAGHMLWNCPEKVNQNTSKGQQQGRVFTTMAGDTARSGGLGIGTRWRLMDPVGDVREIVLINNNGNGGSGAQGLMTLETFLKVNPPKIKGTTNPTKADTCFPAMEQGLQAQLVPEEQCVEFATYLLTGEALHWCCGGVGHMLWNYPEKVNQNTSKGQQQGRVFTTMAGDTARFDGLGIGKRKIGNNVLKV
ncbi:uncharacterized protein LOC107484340 [Arachis duranensis]|uniref:Uncharacterized protein LOC107484340 n=1 Tax=Arachis duranensis TaxID=130453 RepID=A0A6P4D3N2_ARADU|nr:uncharacterized protein LOC107484340 [Arachis duranensis]